MNVLRGFGAPSPAAVPLIAQTPARAAQAAAGLRAAEVTTLAHAIGLGRVDDEDRIDDHSEDSSASYTPTP